LGPFGMPIWLATAQKVPSPQWVEKVAEGRMEGARKSQRRFFARRLWGGRRPVYQRWRSASDAHSNLVLCYGRPLKTSFNQSYWSIDDEML
jgi:hypothetical protein